MRNCRLPLAHNPQLCWMWVAGTILRLGCEPSRTLSRPARKAGLFASISDRHMQVPFTGMCASPWAPSIKTAKPPLLTDAVIIVQTSNADCQVCMCDARLAHLCTLLKRLNSRLQLREVS